jgi:hypothetical protein
VKRRGFHPAIRLTRRTGINETAERACAALTELFSKPIKNGKPHRTYDLTFENGEPVFTLTEIDRWFDGILEEMFGPTLED